MAKRRMGEGMRRLLAVASLLILSLVTLGLDGSPAFAGCVAGQQVTAWDSGNVGGEYGTQNDILVEHHSLSNCTYDEVETGALVFQDMQTSWDEVYYSDNTNSFGEVWHVGVVNNIETCTAADQGFSVSSGDTDSFRVENYTNTQGNDKYWKFAVVIGSTTHSAGNCLGGANHGTASGTTSRLSSTAGMQTTEQPVKYQASQGASFQVWQNPACFLTNTGGDWRYNDASNPKGYTVRQTGSTC